MPDDEDRSCIACQSMITAESCRRSTDCFCAWKFVLKTDGTLPAIRFGRGWSNSSLSDFAMKNPLPDEFQDLAPFLEWALASEQERSAKRQACTIKEIKTFYSAMLQRLEEILTYLDHYPIENVPADADTLFRLTLSLAEVAPAVENFGQPGVVDGYDVKRMHADHGQV